MGEKKILAYGYGKRISNLLKEMEDESMTKKEIYEHGKKAVVKREVMDAMWDIAKKSPEHGNALMDFLGDERYKALCLSRSRKG